ILLWTLLHERRLGLLEEFDSALRNSYRDTGQTLVAEMAEVADTATTAENTSEQAMQMERLEDLGREIKALVNAQSRQIEAIARRLDTVEGNFSQPPAARMTVDRRMQKIPNEQIRVGVFVDVQNMFYAAKKLDGARLNYAVMLDAILKGRRLIKAVAYIVESSDVDQSGFISVLEKKGYLVRRKELKSFMDGTAKGDWDMGMAIDMIEMAEQLDVIVLVSGDGDFVSLVRLIQKTGPRVELYAFGHNLSTELREVSDQFYEITSDLLLKNHYQATSTAADSGNGKAAGEQKDSSAGPPEQEGSGQ
ncbi:MAG: NYN domain-containing protein, partial [Gemmatimonadota bacterium]|nr:NYN domain-containing protein [Gemmatimonadota bacterium]